LRREPLFTPKNAQDTGILLMGGLCCGEVRGVDCEIRPTGSSAFGGGTVCGKIAYWIEGKKTRVCVRAASTNLPVHCLNKVRTKAAQK